MTEATEKRILMFTTCTSLVVAGLFVLGPHTSWQAWIILGLITVVLSVHLALLARHHDRRKAARKQGSYSG